MHISKINNNYQAAKNNSYNNKTFQGKVVFDPQFTQKYSRAARNELKKGIAQLERNSSADTLIEFNIERIASNISSDSYAISGTRKVSNPQLKYQLVEPINDILYSTDVQTLKGHTVNPIAEIRTLFSKGSVYKQRFLGLLSPRYVEDYSLQDGEDVDKRLLKFNILESFKAGIRYKNKDKMDYSKMSEIIDVTISFSSSEDLERFRDNFADDFEKENNLCGNLKKMFYDEMDALFNANIAKLKISEINKLRSKKADSINSMD